MRRYTDAEFTITATGSNFLTATNIHVTLAQAYHKLDITGDDITVVSDTVLRVSLSQQQTSVLVYNEPTEIQVNYLDENGKRHGSDIAPVTVQKNLLETVIESVSV